MYVEEWCSNPGNIRVRNQTNHPAMKLVVDGGHGIIEVTASYVCLEALYKDLGEKLKEWKALHA